MPAAGCCARIAIVGGGFGGIATAVKLEQRGIHDFVVFERSPEPGGTWYDNTYPGCEVDVPSRVYSFSFMPYDWSRTHCGAAELQQYAQDMVDRFARSRFRFGTTVEEVRWIDARDRYEVRLGDGTAEEYEFVVSAVGFLNNPRYPDWDGLDEFTGPAFHTARWEHDHDLTGRTIALVGTGSTAIQLTPELAGIAKHLYVFQREPGWIIPKWSGRYSKTRRALYARFPMTHLLARFCWWVYFETLGRSAFRVGSLTNRAAQKACRYYIRRQIKDPNLRKQVTPDYPFGCKRPIWADTFYPALERGDVTLVPHAVERITADSVVTVEGDNYPVDVLVLATGFLPQQYLRSLPVRGRARHTLAETWKESPRALLGLTVPGFRPVAARWNRLLGPDPDPDAARAGPRTGTQPKGRQPGMTSTPLELTDLALDHAPMQRDRTAGWRYVREGGDIVRDADGTLLFTSLEAVRFAQRNPELFSSAKAFDLLGSPLQLIPLAVDPPDHQRYRAVLDRNLGPKVLDPIEDDLRGQARDLIAAFADRGRCDVVADLGRLYPTQVVLTLYGLPLADRDWFIERAETVLENASREHMEQPPEEVLVAAMDLLAYLQDTIDAKRKEPGDDILSRLVSITGDEAWSDEEILGTSLVFIFGGLDTVTAMIGFVMMHLARNPDLRQRVVADPELIGPLVEEVMRLEAPAPIVPRVAMADVEVCGHSIPAGARIGLCLATANRDPGLFPTPDEIDIDQSKGKQHLTFGGGIHRCLGSHLARRELKLMIEEFHKLIPDYELAPGADPQVHWPSQTVHLESVPLVFGAR